MDNNKTHIRDVVSTHGLYKARPKYWTKATRRNIKNHIRHIHSK